MSKLNLKPVFRSFGSMLEHHAPEFLVSVGIAGMFTSIVLAVKATPKALDDIRDMKAEVCTGNEPAKMEYVKVAWKNYIPAALTALGSTGCIIAGTTVSIRRGTALAAAYKISQDALKEYKEATLDVVGKNKEGEIRARVAEKKLKDNPLDENDIFMTGRGTNLCYDPLSGRYFFSSKTAIEHAVNLFNAALMGDNEKTLNDLYEYLDLDSIDLGEYLGWRYYGDGLKELLSINFESMVAKNGSPALVLMYDVPPRYYDPRVYSNPHRW